MAIYSPTIQISCVTIQFTEIQIQFQFTEIMKKMLMFTEMDYGLQEKKLMSSRKSHTEAQRKSVFLRWSLGCEGNTIYLECSMIFYFFSL